MPERPPELLTLRLRWSLTILKTKPLSDEAGEVRELTSEDMDRFRPAVEVSPEALVAVHAAEEKAGATGGSEEADEGTRDDSLQP